MYFKNLFLFSLAVFLTTFSFSSNASTRQSVYFTIDYANVLDAYVTPNFANPNAPSTITNTQLTNLSTQVCSYFQGGNASGVTYAPYEGGSITVNGTTSIICRVNTYRSSGEFDGIKGVIATVRYSTSPPSIINDDDDDDDYTNPDDWPQVSGVDHNRALQCFQEAVSLCSNGNYPTLWSATFTEGNYYCTTYPNHTCNCSPGNPSCDFTLTTPWPSSPDGGDGGGSGDTGGGSGDTGGGSGDTGGGSGDTGGGSGDTGGGSDWGFTPPPEGTPTNTDLSYVEHLLGVIASHTSRLSTGYDDSRVITAINELGFLLSDLSNSELENLISLMNEDNKNLLNQLITNSEQSNQNLTDIGSNFNELISSLNDISDFLEGNYNSDYSDSFEGLTGFYNRRYESLEQVFTDSLNRIQQTPLFSFAEQFRFNETASTIPSWQFCFDLGISNFGCSEITIPHEIWFFVRIIMILSASFVARKMIIGG